MAILGFEKANAGLKDNLMRFGSGGDIIHCQFVFTGYENTCAGAWEVYGIGFRSFASTVQNPNTRWVWMDFGTQHDAELYEWFRKRLGTQYDFAGLITSFLIPTRKTQNVKTFCSEVCYQACREVLGLNLPAVHENYLSPQQLYNLITTGKP